MWIHIDCMPRAASHPFYEKLNQILEERKFDDFVENQFRGYYSKEGRGRPSLIPGIYFRMLLIGYFEGIDSERGIAWRAADSMAIRSFLRIPLDKETPDHSTISRTRRLVSVETHQAAFNWVLAAVAEQGLLKGNTIGVDATTLEANAAMRSIVRRDSGEKYDVFLTRLATESGIETPTREELAKFDRKRKKKTSNEDWEHPYDPDARVAKMKDGSTHMAHKAEHAVDLETGAVIAVTIQHADLGDTATMVETIAQAGENIAKTAKNVNSPEQGELVNPIGPEAVVADKGYHSNNAMVKLKQAGVRSYTAEPDRGRRNWKDNKPAQKAVYGNRRRIRSKTGKALMRRRGELVERSFAHLYDTGGMRRTHLKGGQNILKRVLIHVGAFNLSLIMRQLIGKGTPRGLQGGVKSPARLLSALRFWLLVYPSIVNCKVSW